MAKSVKHLSAVQLSLFASQISLFLRSGVTLSEGLAMAEDEIADPKFKDAVNKVRINTQNRFSFHEALAETNKFPQYMVQMAKIGEQSGKLDEVMDALTLFYERQTELKQQVRSAITYPLMLLSIMTLVVFVLIVRVLPLFSSVLASLGQDELPWIAAALIDFGEKFSRFFWFLAILAVAAFFVIKHSKQGAEFAERFKARSIFTRSVYKMMAAERFSVAMAFLLHAGVEVSVSMELAGELLGNSYLSEKFAKCNEQMKNGESLSDVVKNAEIFPEQFSKLLAIGVKTGELDMMMTKLSEIYSKKVESTLKKLTGIIEPVFVSILSIVVGIIMVSVMLPLIDIMSNIG